jgi:hypothetical protein
MLRTITVGECTPKTVLDYIPGAPIGDSKTHYVGSVPRTERLGNDPYKEPCPHGALLTVCPTTQSEHRTPQIEYISSQSWGCKYSYIKYWIKSI